MSTTSDWPGSRWWRVDLHTHSPASYDFAPAEDRRQPDWTRWIKAVRDADLHAVAVTDHNTSAGIENIQRAAAALSDAPIVFPGVEVTASCGTHLLFILDPDRGQADTDDFLSKANVPVAQRGTDTARSPWSVEQLLAIGSQCGGLLIAAHINGPAGLLEHDGQQRIQELRHPSLAGVEVDPTKALDETWLNGSRPEIARRLPRIWCSDAHQHAELGRRFTWVKMTRPDLEGLRLALLDGNESSLVPVARGASDDPNTHASLLIEEITVNDAKHMGRSTPLTFRFNPWLNAIIGGRGTGKSTLIDFVRKTLRREAELDGTSLRDVFDKRLSVPGSRMEEGLLTANARLEIVYRKDGERFVISWDHDGKSAPIQRLSGTDRTAEDGDVRERFPVRVYSQKQLFELARDPNALLNVIDDSATVRGAELRRQLHEAELRYLSLQADARTSRATAAELPNCRASLADVRRKLDILQQGGSAQALADFRLRRQQDAKWRAILSGVDSSIDTITRAANELLVADLGITPNPPNDPGALALEAMHAKLKAIVSSLQDQVLAAIASALQELGDLGTGSEAQTWRAMVAATEAEYEKVAAQLTASGISSPTEYRDLMERASLLERQIERLEGADKRASDLGSQAIAELARYRALRNEWTQRRSTFTQETSGSLLRVVIKAHGDRQIETVMASLRGILRIERFDADYAQLARRLDPGSQQPWTADRLDALVADLRTVVAGQGASFPAQDARFIAALRRLSPEQVDRLALYAPDDAVEVSFHDHRRPGESWTPLAQGSPGQQTAALLAFVLGYGDEPILLDQPEDDLDNTLIYELLVRRLRETKSARQVIVVTHNPNIVVHGDAELVVSLEAKNGQTRIRCAGGLQEEAVREEICRVMEGGREAFETRYRRIMPPRNSPP